MRICMRIRLPASHSPTSSSNHFIVCCPDKWRWLILCTRFTVPTNGPPERKICIQHQIELVCSMWFDVNCFLNKSDNCLWLAAKRCRIASYNVVARWSLDNSLVPSPYFANISRDNRQSERKKNIIISTCELQKLHIASFSRNANINKWISFADSELWTIYGNRMHFCYIFNICEPGRPDRQRMPKCQIGVFDQMRVFAVCELYWCVIFSLDEIYGNKLCKLQWMVWDCSWSRNMGNADGEVQPIFCIAMKILCVPFDLQDSNSAATISTVQKPIRKNVILENHSDCCSAECIHIFDFFVEISYANQTDMRSKNHRPHACMHDQNEPNGIHHVVGGGCIRLHQLLFVCSRQHRYAILPIGQW